MAQHDEPREDLLREATALIERMEVVLPDYGESIVAGFRPNGAASFFFGQQTVYQFNSASELRRGFVEGRLYKVEQGRLVQLIRKRTSNSVDLLRHVLTPEESVEFLAGAKRHLQILQRALATGQCRVIGQLPPLGDVADRVYDWLSNLPNPIPVASSSRLN